jgi:hypothetical protein
MTVFSAILFSQNHSAIFFISELTLLTRSGKWDPVFSAVVSAGNKNDLRLVQFRKSFMEMRNNMGPSNEDIQWLGFGCETIYVNNLFSVR